MKNWFILFGLLLVLLTPSFAQKPFTGTLFYETTVEGDFADLIEDNLLTDFQIQIRKGNLKILTSNATTGRDFLYASKEDVWYEIDHHGQKVTRLRPSTETPPHLDALEATDEIDGINCYLYQVAFTDQNGTAIKQTFWVQFDISSPKSSSSSLPLVAHFFHSGLPGFPLKIETEITTKYFSGVIKNLVSEISFDKPKRRMFKLPRY